MKCYKLTNQNGQTKNNTQWGENVTHSAQKSGGDLCSSSWIHFYTNPLIAILMNPRHANFYNPILWESESAVEEKHELLKSGCKTLTTIKQIPLPEISLVSKVAFGILCVKKVYKDVIWNKWADRWLNNTDRTMESAGYATAGAAGSAAGAAAADAADAAAGYAAGAAGYAAGYAAAAAAAAADAADAADTVNFIKLAEQSLTYK